MRDIKGNNLVKESIRLHFEGEAGIDINILISSLEYTKTTLKSTRNAIPGINKYEIFVEPFKEGSFIIDIAILTFMANELLPIANTMSSVFLDTLKIWQVLKGKPAKEVITNTIDNSVKIVGDNNTVINVSPEALNVTMDTKKIADNIADLARNMISDSTNRTNLKISVESNSIKETLTYSKNDLEGLKTPVYLKESLSEETITINHIIVKPNIVNFEKIDDWKFSSSFNDKPFKAKIEDDKFKLGVKNGNISFGTDTRLKVVLQTIETSTKDGTDRKKYEHSILKVEDIIDPDSTENVSMD